jgi:hypothetical protein
VDDRGALAVAMLVACGALLAVYLRLRREHDRTTAWLSIILMAGATPLLPAITQGVLSDATMLAVLSAVGYFVLPRVAPRWAQTIALVVATLIAALVTPDASTPPSLFSPASGFLARTPVVYIAVGGLIAGARTFPAECAAALTALLLWPATGTSLVPALAWLAPGLAFVITWVRHRPMAAALPLIAGAIVWNYWLMVQYTAGSLPKDAPVRFAAMVRQQADVHTRAPYIYVFAFPGNLVDAWRQGIPLTRYDALAGEPRHDRFTMAFDGSTDRFLLDGWGRLDAGAAGPFRTVVADRAELLFPLTPTAADIELIIAVTLRDTAVSSADAVVEINGRVIGRMEIEPNHPEEHRLRVRASDVGDVFRAGYNRLSIVTAAPVRLAIHHLRIAPTA